CLQPACSWLRFFLSVGWSSRPAHRPAWPVWKMRVDPLPLDRAPRTLARARIGAGALAAQRQAATVAQAAIGTEVDQSLDRHADLATQVTLDDELGDLVAKLLDLGLGQVLDLGRRVDARQLAHLARAG